MIYNYDCRQPDPEIWGGGSTTGNVSISGESHSRVIKKYPPEEPFVTGTLYGASSDEHLIKTYVGDVVYPTLSGACVEKVIFNPPEGTFQHSFSGAASGEQVVYSDDLTEYNVYTSGFILEKVTYDYNIESIEFYVIDDFGSVGFGEPILSSDDYELISLYPDAGQDNFGLIAQKLENSNPFGTILFGGGSLHSFVSSDDITTGLIQLSSGCVEKVTFEPPIDETYLYPLSSTESTFDNDNLTFDSNEPKPNIKLSGSAIEKFEFDPPEETQNITTDIYSIEKVAYDYNEDSVLSYQELDYGLINEFVTTGDLDYGGILLPLTQGEESFGDIRFAGTIPPYGTVTISGSALVIDLPDIRTYNTGATYRVSYNPPENEASLFSFGQRETENVVYDYNESSTVLLDLEDLGDITISHSDSDDYGLITGTFINENRDYGTIQFNTSLYPFGLFGISGSADVEYTNKNFYGYVTGAEVKVVYSPDDGYGSLFGFGERETENVTYSYNESSAVIYEIIDYGSVNSIATNFADDGFIFEPVAGIDDYGTFDIVESTYPFGLFGISGSAETEHINKNFYGYVTGAEVKVVYSPEDGSGILFGFGERETENVIYDYNESSIYLVGDTDFGQLVDPILGSTDYGFVSVPHGPSDDYGDLIGSSTTEDIYPFGTINISGQISSEIVSADTPDNTILVDISGVVDESVTYTPPVNQRLYQKELSSTELTFDSIDLSFDSTEEVPDIKLTGSGGIVPATYSEVGSGSLFNFGELEESVTYDYNEESILYLLVDDLGELGVGYSDSSDYGNISAPLSQGTESYGLIEDTQTEYPFGNLTISGSADVIFQNYDIYGSGVVSLTYSPDGLGGSLFAFGDKYESVTYDYSESSIFFFVIDDYGSVSVAYTGSEDYGFVSEVYVGTPDYGLLDSGFGVPETIYPFGGITISGTTEPELVTYSIESTSLFVISGSSYTDYTPSPDGSGSLYIAGSAHVTFSPDFVASDTTTLSGIVEESITYNYNENSQNNPFVDYGLINEPVLGTNVDYGIINGDKAGKSEDHGLISSATETEYPYGTLTIYGGLDHPDIDYTPAYTGSGTITISGSALESETDDFGSGRRRGGNIRFCGDAIYSETDSYVGIGTIILDREGVVTPALISRTRSYVGIETIILSDSALEVESESYVASGIISLSGSLIEKFTGDTPDGTQLFTIYGELNHPDIDYTPHYGIEKNIGIGTTGIQLSGTGLESESEAYVGLGTVVLNDGLTESFTRFVPTSGIGTGFIGGEIRIFNDVTRYYSPVYPRNALIGDPGSGIGTIRINDDNQLTYYRATLPYIARGTIFVTGVGEESFVESPYLGTGLFTISGIASTREIAVYTEVGIGTIIISEQTSPSIEKNTENYVGSGQITLSETLDFRETNSYAGSGSFKTNILATWDLPDLTFDVVDRTFDEVPTSAYESFTVDLPETTLDITISGSAESAFVAQPVEDSALYTFYGSVSDIQLTHSEVGSGSIILSGSAETPFLPGIVGFGGIRFVSVTGDGDYPTCDSEDYTCDRLDSANYSVTYNTPENVAQITISGSALDVGYKLREYDSTGLFEISGIASDIKITKDYVGIGTLFTISGSLEKQSNSYVGFGSIVTFSGSAESIAVNDLEGTQLIQISGSALTQITTQTSAVGLGNINISGTLEERKTDSYNGTGTLSLYGEVVEPTGVRFIPAGIGAGTINIDGNSENSLTKRYYDTAGTLFVISSGTESFSRPTYSGLGTIFFDSTVSGITTNNPYQIPRVYVCII